MRTNSTGPQRQPYPINPRPTAQLPTLPRYLDQVRNARNWSRREAHELTGISEHYIRQIETGKRQPSAEMLEKLADKYQLTPAQARHARELLAPALSLPSLESLHHRIERTPQLTGHLADLDARDIPAIATDPLGNILLCNTTMDDAFPELRQIGNIARWYFHAACEPILIDRDSEINLLVATIKGVLGRYRTTPEAIQLLRYLRRYHDFTRRWNSSIRIAYGRETCDPFHWRHPGNGLAYSAIVHQTDVFDTQHITLHTMLPTPRALPKAPIDTLELCHR